VGAWCERWNIKINEAKPQAIYFSTRRRTAEDLLQVIGWNITFLNNAKYIKAIFDRRTTWRLQIETNAAKVLGTYIRAYFILKSKHESANIKLIVFR
jgi:ABC-type transporter MlaC component